MPRILYAVFSIINQILFCLVVIIDASLMVHARVAYLQTPEYIV